MQQFADMTITPSALPAPFTNAPYEKLIGLKFRILNIDLPDHYVYEVTHAEEHWDERWGLQYNIRCNVIQGTSAQPEGPEDLAHLQTLP